MFDFMNREHPVYDSLLTTVDYIPEVFIIFFSIFPTTLIKCFSPDSDRGQGKSRSGSRVSLEEGGEQRQQRERTEHGEKNALKLQRGCSKSHNSR